MKYRKKPIVIEAHQWFKNGDHPKDYFGSAYEKRHNWEGHIVRYFRNPDIPGKFKCEECGEIFHVHGWIDTKEGGHRVCPGDWIITGIKGERYPCKPDIFAQTYEKEEL